MFSLKSALALFALIAVALGCQSNKESQSSGGGINSAFTAQSTWTSGCFDSDRFGLTMDSRFELSNGSFTRTNRYYSDGTCSDLAIQSVEEGSSSYSGDSTSGAIDFNYSNVEITPLSAAGILALNSVTFCGSNTWSLNQPRDITASSGLDSCWEKTPRTVHDIYQVSGDEIYFGAGSEREKGGSIRPSALDQSRVWKIH